MQVTVIFAVPFFFPVTTPFEDTVAIFLLEDVYFIVPDGVAFGLIVVFLPTLILAEVLASFSVGFLTVTVQLVFRLPHLTVITAFPAALATILPVVLLTVTTFVLLEVNVTLDASTPFTEAFRVVLVPL